MKHAENFMEKLYTYSRAPRDFDKKLGGIRSVLENEKFEIVNEGAFKNYFPEKFSRSSWNYESAPEKTRAQVYEIRHEGTGEQFISVFIRNRSGRDLEPITGELMKYGMSKDVGPFEEKLLKCASVFKYDSWGYPFESILENGA
jgi:hypothetical protein